MPKTSRCTTLAAMAIRGTRRPASPGRRQLLGALALGGLLGGGRSAQACEFFADTLRVYHPWLRATGRDAAAAILCMTLDEVTRDDRLLYARSPVAQAIALDNATADATTGVPAEWALPVRAGQVLVMREDGLHLRMTGLKLDLEVGRSYPLLLGFEHGGVVKAQMNIDFPRFG